MPPRSDLQDPLTQVVAASGPYRQFEAAAFCLEGQIAVGACSLAKHPKDILGIAYFHFPTITSGGGLYYDYGGIRNPEITCLPWIFECVDTLVRYNIFPPGTTEFVKNHLAFVDVFPVLEPTNFSDFTDAKSIKASTSSLVEPYVKEVRRLCPNLIPNAQVAFGKNAREAPGVAGTPDLITCQHTMQGYKYNSMSKMAGDNENQIVAVFELTCRMMKSSNSPSLEDLIKSGIFEECKSPKLVFAGMKEDLR